jgi:hypothetical protein
MVTLYACEDDKAATRVTEPGAERVGTIHVDFTHVNLESLKTKSVDGKSVYRFDYSIEVSMGFEEGMLRFAAKRGDEYFGTTEMKYEHE